MLYIGWCCTGVFERRNGLIFPLSIFYLTKNIFPKEKNAFKKWLYITTTDKLLLGKTEKQILSCKSYSDFCV